MYKKYEKLIIERGLTTAEVSKSTGIPEPVFSNWKSRNGKLSADNLYKIAVFLNVPMEYFLDDGA